MRIKCDWYPANGIALHEAALDRAVWAAYGWHDSDPAKVPDETILTRLLALNGGRAANRPT